MIDTLIKKIEFYKTTESSLQTEYANLLPQEFYKNAHKAIYENIPNKVQELSKVLNLIDQNNSFPEENLTYDSAVEMLNNRKNEILDLIEKSKENNTSTVIIPNVNLTPHKVILLLIDQIGSTGEMANMYFKAAKLKNGEF